MWLILRTDHGKEQYVCRQIINAGFDAWVPAQIIVCRPHIARRITTKAQLQKIRELPILPRRLFAAIPVALQAEVQGIRHLVAIERDTASQAISVPPSQIAAFRDTIDRENTASLALAQKAKQKQKWRSLHDALVDMIEQAKGQLEAAA